MAIALRPTGQTAGVTTLAVLPDNASMRSAYSVARECTFVEEEHGEAFTDHEIVNLLAEMVADAQHPHRIREDKEDVYYHYVDDALGVLSTHLFPWSAEDAQAARDCLADYESIYGYFPYAHETDSDYHDTMPIPRQTTTS